MDTIFVIFKALFFLGIPLGLGLWELSRHRKMMRNDKAKAASGSSAGAASTSAIPRWLQAQKPQPRPGQRRADPAQAADRAPVADPAPTADRAQKTPPTEREAA